MKGVILTCLQELVTTKYGKDKWDTALAEAGYPKKSVLLAVSEVDDATALSIVESVCRNVGITLPEAADAFGEFWSSVYSRRLYQAFYERNRSAKAFLLDMDRVHVAMTRGMPNATPPRFEYEWRGEDTLVMHYRSGRGLVDFVVGLAKGVGSYYGESLEVTKLSADQVQVRFPPQA
jgi:hypothetical protein